MLLRNLLLVLAALAGLSIRKHNHKSYIGVYVNAPIAGPYNLMSLEEINALPALELAAVRRFSFIRTTQRFRPAASSRL